MGRRCIVAGGCIQLWRIVRQAYSVCTRPGTGLCVERRSPEVSPGGFVTTGQVIEFAPVPGAN
ncbi:hypothetical protein [Citrobacter portucalensis]|uniref:hypothetical protein n=1 Tax=Citrobacter portucalensis TaxID=1639133 RepID=UPI0039FD30F3